MRLLKHISKILNLIFNHATDHSNYTYCEGNKGLAFKSLQNEKFQRTNPSGFMFLQRLFHIFTIYWFRTFSILFSLKKVHKRLIAVLARRTHLGIDEFLAIVLRQKSGLNEVPHH